jgi:hypothetical protein
LIVSRRIATPRRALTSSHAAASAQTPVFLAGSQAGKDENKGLAPVAHPVFSRVSAPPPLKRSLFLNPYDR